MAEAVIYAEFDIDQGSVVRSSYPPDKLNQVASSTEVFADLMLPDGTHNRNDDYTVFFLNRKSENEPVEDISKPFLYCLSVVQTRQDTSVRRGAIVKAVALCSRYSCYFAFKGVLDAALEKLMENVTDSSDLMQQLYETINQVDVSEITRASEIDRRFRKRALCANPLGKELKATTKLFHSTQVMWGPQVIPIEIRLCSTPDQHDEGLLIDLVKTFKENTMKIYNAVLCGSRIIMLGYNQPAGLVCNLVLSTSALVCPPLCNLSHRQFPYANLTDLAFLQVPSFITGVTNPMFKGKQEWWDVFCDISTGEVLYSPQDNPITSCDAADLAFIYDVLDGIENQDSEDYVRRKFEEYTLQNIVQVANGTAVYSTPQEQARHIAINNERVTKWSRTDSHRDYMKALTQYSDCSPAFNVKVSKADLQAHVRTLVAGAALNEQDVEKMFGDFVRLLKSETEMKELLSYLPESAGGLHVIAQGLLHPKKSVKKNTVILLQRMEEFTTTKLVVDALNTFDLVTYRRLAKTFESDGP